MTSVINHTLKLRLLALVLALALTWYAINPAPAPRPVRRVKREGERPEEERINARAGGASPSYSGIEPPRRSPSSSYAPPSSLEDDDDALDWPEFIDLD